MDRTLQYAGDYSMAMLGGTFLPERRFKRPVPKPVPQLRWTPRQKPQDQNDEDERATDNRPELNN